MVLHEITVGFTPVAEAHLKLLPREEQAKAVSYIKRIHAGELGDATPLRHVNGLIWRKKLGDIRILFTYDKRNKEVIIRALMWRREDTYEDLTSLVNEVDVEKKNRQTKLKEKQKLQKRTESQAKKANKNKRR
jgi:mRNA-degrading endonuclease RelE of RelBE toxin-antitoxin system